MAFTQDQKRRLITAYEPILYLHPEERFGPVDPAGYVEQAALWCTTPADPESRHQKENWGGCRSGGEGDYPHEPLIPKQGIALTIAHDTEGSEDLDDDGVPEWYLGHIGSRGSTPYMTSNSDRMLWLESAGWAEGEGVTGSSINEVCAVEQAATLWQAEPYLSAADHHYADVEDFGSMEDVIQALLQQGIDLPGSLSGEYGRAWILTYHFLFPIHEAGEHNLWSYEGDWNALAIVMREPEGLRDISDPAELSTAIDRQLALWEAEDSFPLPALVAFGRRTRGTAMAGGALETMDFYAPGEAALFGTHARVFVARGSHNFYPNPGAHEPPATAPPTCEPTWVEPGPDYPSDDAVVGTLIVATLGKMAGGAGLGSAGGPIGAAVGLVIGWICAVVEALAGIGAAPSLPGDETFAIPSPDQDLAPVTGDYGVILVPPGSEVDFAEADQAQEVRPWAGAPQERVVNRDNQRWWASISGRRGYDGRWGVMCQNDRCDARSGMQQPNFRELVLSELVLHLSR